MDKQGVAIIIPVFNAYEETKRCIKSVLQHSSSAVPIVLIDDASTDDRMWPLLSSHSTTNAQITAIRHSKNMGYTKTINEGMRTTRDHDVVLLNSDTIVSAHWLTKLLQVAYSRANVATVTPVSNAAGAFSVPKRNHANPLPPGYTVDMMAELVERVSPTLFPPVPTGNGFCMVIRRSALNLVGLFDEKAFPVGYGEENDFCLRASEVGCVNLVDDATFIFHHRTSSFKDRKKGFVRRAQRVLKRKYPNYESLIKEWFRNDPLDVLRKRLSQALNEE